MQNYFLFLMVATATVLSPGPGVILTLTNALRYGFRGSLGGIFGIALGSLIVAALSATSVGVILASSATAFAIIKYIGAAYLIFLGIKLWRNPNLTIIIGPVQSQNFRKRFAEGFSVQMTNPKSIFFFISIFPQFIDRTSAYITQFALLVFTYSSLIIVIHCTYALMAKRAQKWLSTPKGGRMVNKCGGGTLVCFGLLLANANR